MSLLFHTYLILMLLIQAMYNEFSSMNIQIDKDFSAKLSGYGCVSHNPDTEFMNTSAVSYCSYSSLNDL